MVVVATLIPCTLVSVGLDWAVAVVLADGTAKAVASRATAAACASRVRDGPGMGVSLLELCPQPLSDLARMSTTSRSDHRLRARCAAAFTRFWHAVEQNRRVPLRVTSTNTRSHIGASHTPRRSAYSVPSTVARATATPPPQPD